MLLGPLHVSHSEWHASHVFVEVFAYLPFGQTVRHVVPSRYLNPEQLKQLLLSEPEQEAQVGSHESQVFVAPFS